MDLIRVLNSVTVINRDDGVKFTVTERIDAIVSLLCGSKYRRINSEGLFILYASNPLSEYKNREVVVVTSHIDCERSISQCFSKREQRGILKGTFDNSITNAAIIYLMVNELLPDNVLVAFTGDEEVCSNGAVQLSNFLSKNEIKTRHIFVLDVTDMGWEEEADFTIENNFWKCDHGQRIIQAAKGLPYNWRFVPSDLDDVPSYVPPKLVMNTEAECDESWEFAELGINCCSICLPIKGVMHSNHGVFVRELSLYNYTKALSRIITAYIKLSIL